MKSYGTRVPRDLSSVLRRFFDVRPGEARRVGLMAAILFFLLAANNVIKVIRDALFLSRFPIKDLPYVYLMAALFAGVVISIYSRYTERVAISQVILGSYAFIISNVVIFWIVITLYDFGWIFYAFYIWSAVVGLVAVAQFWTLANDMFNSREGKRLFGTLTAAGTVGGMAGGIAANWTVNFLFGTKQLLWLIVVLFSGAFAVVWFGVNERKNIRAVKQSEVAALIEIKKPDAKGIVGTLRGSKYLQTIAALSFVSIIVSTLIDYQFKAAAKAAYPSPDALASFFGAYYAWLSVATMFAQVWLTGRLLMAFGLTPSLLILPTTLLAGSVSLLVWSGLFAATANRFAEATLRTSVNHSGLEVLYLPIPDYIKKKIKVFLDVTVERLGDGMAAFIILFYTFVLGGHEITRLSYFSIALILFWVALVFVVQGGYVEALRGGLAYREVSFENAGIDFADRGTLDAVMKILRDSDERAVLFGLDLVEKWGPKHILSRLPDDLLHHSSALVRARAIRLLVARPDTITLGDITQMLRDEDKEVQAQAISAASAIFKEAAIAVVSPYIESPDPQVKRQAMECLLRHGDARTRAAALNSLRNMVNDNSAGGEQSRLQAVQLMAEVDDPEFSTHLGRLIREDQSLAVIRAAMAAAAMRKYAELVRDVVLRLGSNTTKAAARDALIEYRDLAVKELRTSLSRPHLARDIRLNIPRTLSKIHSQSALNALLEGLLEEDRSIRFKVILALEEMIRRFADLKVDREIVESAIKSDAQLYYRRFAILTALFGRQDKSLSHGESILYFALTDSIERVKERMMWLLSLIYPAKDIRRFWAGLNSGEPNRRARAVEFLDNLLKGEIKRYVFPLFGDAPPAQRFRASLDFLGIGSFDTDSALRALLEQNDVWLKAAGVWEIGIRGLTGFGDQISEFLDSESVVLSEAAAKVIHRI
jgi:AAA family ATP:ADP antiporter